MGAFTGDIGSFYRSSSQNRNARSTLYMGGATGYATSLPGKKDKVEKVQNLLSSSQMIFSVMPSSLTVKETSELRNALPEGTTMSVVKNKLMARAIDGTVLDASGVEKIADMPSKQELIARIAGGIKAVPTKVARVVNAPGSKLARAIKLAGETLEES